MNTMKPYDLHETTCYQCDKVIYREKPGQGLCVVCKIDNAEAEKYDKWIERINQMRERVDYP